jgi:hypothetical protein
MKEGEAIFTLSLRHTNILTDRKTDRNLYELGQSGKEFMAGHAWFLAEIRQHAQVLCPHLQTYITYT